MDKKKQPLSSSAVFIRIAIVGIIFGLILNQLSIIYFAHKYLNSGWLAHFYHPLAAYRMTKFFLVHNDLYISKLGFVEMGAGEAILYITFLGGTFIAVLIILFIYRELAGKKLFSDRHGTARFQTENEILKSNRVDPPDSPESFKKYGRWGIFSGALESSQGTPISWKDDDQNVTNIKLKELAHFGSQHVIVFAPTGSFKGVGIVMPILVTYPSSIFCLDIKKENALATSGYRHKKFNNVVIIFEPTCADGTSARYNPLAEIRIGTIYEAADAQKLALAIVDQEGKGLHDHWTKKAWGFMTGVILHILYIKKNRTLNGLALFISGIDPDTNEIYEDEVAWLNEMTGKTAKRCHVKGYAKLKNISEEDAEKHLIGLKLIGQDGINIMVKAAAAPLASSKAQEERSSIISSTEGPLALYKDPVIAANTSTSDFKLDDLQNFSRPVSFYLVIPADQRDRIKPLVRLLIMQTIASIQSQQTGKKREITFLLDELPELHKIEVLESALATIRGYKVRMVLITQNLDQLTKYYGETQSIFSNCGVRIAYAPNDAKTAEMLSKYTGVMTYVAKSTSTTINKQPFQITSGGGSTTVTTQETQRNLLTLDEIMHLNDDMLILIEKKYPIRGHKFAWFLSDKFRKRIFDVEHATNPGNKNYPPIIKSHRIVRTKKG